MVVNKQYPSLIPALYQEVVARRPGRRTVTVLPTADTAFASSFPPRGRHGLYRNPRCYPPCYPLDELFTDIRFRHDH